MTSHRYQVVGILFLSLVSISLSACLPSIGPSTRSKPEGEFAQGKAVEGFPNLPLYEDAQTIETFGGSQGFGGSFIANDSLAKVVKFYNEALPALGWQTQANSSGPNHFVFDVKNEKYQGSVTVNMASDGKKTAITMSVVQR